MYSYFSSFYRGFTVSSAAKASRKKAQKTQTVEP
jgi:hypothetical protein